MEKVLELLLREDLDWLWPIVIITIVNAIESWYDRSVEDRVD